MSAVCLKPGSGCLLQVLRSVFLGMQFPITIYCCWSCCRSLQPFPGVVWCPFMGCTLCWLSKMSQDKLGHEENKRIIQLKQWKSTREGAGSLGEALWPGGNFMVTFSKAVFHSLGFIMKFSMFLDCSWRWCVDFRGMPSNHTSVSGFGFFTLKPPYTASADVVCNHLKLI